MNTQTDACIHAKTPAHTVDSQTHPENFELAHTQYSEDLSSFIPAFMLNREQTWSLCGVCVCVCGRTKSAGADSGEHGRGLIAAQTSVLERRCQNVFSKGGVHGCLPEGVGGSVRLCGGEMGLDASFWSPGKPNS